MQLDCASDVSSGRVACVRTVAMSNIARLPALAAASLCTTLQFYIHHIISTLLKYLLRHIINLQLLLLNCILYIYFIIVYFNMHNLLLLHFFVSKYSFVRIHIFFLFEYWNVMFRNVYVCAILVTVNNFNNIF